MKKNNIFARIWEIAYPFLFYYAVMLSVMTVCQWLLGSSNRQFALCQLVASSVTIPFMLPFYRQDRALEGIARKKPHVTKENAVCAAMSVLIAACIGTGLNNIISMTPLVAVSQGYQEANAGFYGSTIMIEIISSAVVTPILEELVFRGILYPRLKKQLSFVPAVFVSALLFASMHFNVVQFTFALLLGVVLALLAEQGGNVCYAVYGHMAVNFLAILRTETGFLDRTVKGDAFSWAVSAAVLGVGLVLAFFWLGMRRKH